MFILYKKKDILTFFADVKFSTDEQKKLFFLFWTFSFFIRILGFYFPFLVVLLVFLFLHFFFPSFPPPPTHCLLISFYLSSTKLHFSLSLMYLFSFLGRSILWLHPLATLTGCDWALLFFVSHPDRISWL